MRRVGRWAVAGLAFAMLLAGGTIPATGQEAATLRLTLEQALDLASGSNPELRRATNSTLLNGTEMRTTWLDQLLPSASLTLFNTGFTGNLQRKALDVFGNPVAKPGAEWNYFSRTTHNLGFRWEFQGPSLFQAYRRQTLVNEDRDLARVRALTDVQIRVRRLYLAALEQRALMQAEEELIEARTIDLDVAERLFSLALKTRVDLLNAELAIEQQRLALRQQEAAYERALLSLKTAMGLTDTRPIEIVDEELPVFDPVDFDADALVSRALEVNPALRQSEVAISTAKLGLSEQKRAWWPKIAMGIDVYRQAYSQKGEALFDPSVSRDLESQFFVNFSLPILNGVFRQNTDRQRAAIDLSNQRETDRQARLELEEAVRGALLDLENQWESLRLSERSNAIADEALRLAREEYRLGTRSFEDLRSGFQQEADTRRQVITARHSFVKALLTLAEAVGTPIGEMIPASSGAGGS
jgi:outer membrane protein